ncbi:MAG: hypothetical protein ACFWUM_06250 [Eubacteriales bacterium]
MITITRKAMSLILTFAMLFAMVQATGVTAYAASSDYDRDSGDRDSHQTMLFAVSSSDDDRTVLYVDSGDITINGDTGGYVITQKDSEKQTSHTITVTEGIHNITLRGVNINSSGSPFSIQAGATVYLTLENENRLIGGMNYAGLEVQAGTADKSDASLIITDKSSGSLEAKGGDYSAGIGGNLGRRNGDITISGGTVTANGVYGAGIGSGFYGFGGEITISGGTVTATGVYGAGIGGGAAGSGGEITISGGTVTATGIAGGAGIGGGDHGNGGTIEISGGTVTANSDYYGIPDCGAGIGGGNNGDGGTITISGGTVTANSDYGAGIGGGNNGDGGRITISGGTVTTTSDYGAGIGDGFDCGLRDSTITITGSGTKVTAKGYNDIGSGKYYSAGGSLTVGEDNVTDGPTVELQNSGTNANQKKFVNCNILGTGAKSMNIMGHYNKDGDRLPIEITLPTASAIASNSNLSVSQLSGGEVLDNDKTIEGTFSWKYGTPL